MSRVLVGLCAACAHARVVESRRGSRFWLCERSRTDPAFPRYPPLPVLACRGYEPGVDRPAAPESLDSPDSPDSPRRSA